MIAVENAPWRNGFFAVEPDAPFCEKADLKCELSREAFPLIAGLFIASSGDGAQNRETGKPDCAKEELFATPASASLSSAFPDPSPRVGLRPDVRGVGFEIVSPRNTICNFFAFDKQSHFAKSVL